MDKLIMWVLRNFLQPQPKK